MDFLNQTLNAHDKTPPFEEWLNTEGNMSPAIPSKTAIRPQEPVFPGFFGTSTKDNPIDKWTDPFWKRPVNAADVNAPLLSGERGLPGALPPVHNELPFEPPVPLKFSTEGLFQAPGISESERLEAARRAMEGGPGDIFGATNTILDKYPNLFNGPVNPEFKGVGNTMLPADKLPPLPPYSMPFSDIDYNGMARPMNKILPDITPKK